MLFNTVRCDAGLYAKHSSFHTAGFSTLFPGDSGQRTVFRNKFPRDHTFLQGAQYRVSENKTRIEHRDVFLTLGDWDRLRLVLTITSELSWVIGVIYGVDIGEFLPWLNLSLVAGVYSLQRIDIWLLKGFHSISVCYNEMWSGTRICYCIIGGFLCGCCSCYQWWKNGLNYTTIWG